MSDETSETFGDPEHGSERDLDWFVVKSAGIYLSDGEKVMTVTSEDGSTCSVPYDLGLQILAADRVSQETVRGSMVVGWLLDGKWVARKSDQQLEREHQEFIEKNNRERRERLEANREDWQRRTEALPDWAQARVENFRARGGERFEVGGWGYELAVVELAVIYDSVDLNDDADEISAYAREHGTTGNQHGFARALARAHREGEDDMIAQSVSALSPLTGDAFYNKSS